MMTDRLEHRLAHDLEAAFPDFVRAHQDGVFSAALAMLRHRQDAEDVTQETFVRAYRALGGYEPARIRELRPRPWLATIALNLVRNRARTASRRPATVGPPTWDRPDFDPGPEDVAAVAAEAEEWRTRLAELSSVQRRAVVLRHVWGLPGRDVAEALGVPENTAKSHVSRGLAALRAQMEVAT